MRRATVDLLRENYTAIAKDLFGPLRVVLATARDTFGGDMDKFMALLEIALRTMEDRRFPQVKLEDVLSGAVESYPSLHTNIRSVAAASGIPRETVRRKVLELVEEGWVSRHDHNLALTPKATQQMTAVREAILDMAARYHLTISDLKNIAS